MALRVLLLALLVAALAACGRAGETDVAAPPGPEAEPAETAPAPAPAPPPGPARPLLGEVCGTALDGRIVRLAELEQAIERARAARAEAQQRIASSQSELAAGEREAAAARAATEEAQARASAAADALRAFTAQHGTTLTPNLYARWEELRAAYDEARALYEQRFAAYEAAAERHRRLVDAQNAAVDAHNAATEELNARARERPQLVRSWIETLEGCADALETIPQGEAPRVAELEERLASAVTAIAERDAEVRCEPAPGWPEREDGTRVLGYVRGGEPPVHLAPEVCHALHSLLHLGRPGDLSCLERSRAADERLCLPDLELLARSLATVAHEAQHVAGVMDEAEAECFGLQAVTEVGEALGLSAATTRLAAWYVWRFAQSPPEYRSPECRPGGALDRRPPGSAHWP